MKLDNKAIKLIQYLRNINPTFWTQARLAEEFGVNATTIKHYTNPESRQS